MIPKFRAWDKETQIMLDVPLIDYKKRGLVGEHWEFGETNFISFDDANLMQSTGLKDKNGKEIFEGDVLEIQGLRMVVKFGSYRYLEPSNIGCQSFAVVYDGLGFYVKTFNVIATDDISPFEPETLKESVVIGNRFENPEFLEDKG